MVRRRLLATLASTLLFALAEQAQATELLPTVDASSPPSYEVPEGCPGRDAFDHEVELRTPARARLPLRARVRVGLTDGGYEGHVWGGNEPGDLVRDVRGATCKEVLQVLALALATAADDEVGTLAQAPGPAQGSTALATDTAGERLPPRSWDPTLGVGFGVTQIAGPSAGAAVSAFGGIESATWSLRLGASAASGGSVALSTGSARFQWWGVGLEGCPWAWALAEQALRVSPCAGAQGGDLRASGSGMENAESAHVFSLAVHLATRLDWYLSRRWFLETEARAVFATLRHTFYVRQAEEVYRVPVAALEANFSAGVRFSK